VITRVANLHDGWHRGDPVAARSPTVAAGYDRRANPALVGLLLDEQARLLSEVAFKATETVPSTPLRPAFRAGGSG